MSTGENKRIATGLLEDLSRGNTKAVLNAMAENATWWTAGNLPRLSGTKTKQEMSKLFDGLGSLFPKGLKITVDNAIAEGNYVAVEAHSYAEMKTGKIYQNKYHWLFEIRDKKVQTVKEYMDTVHAEEVLLELIEP